MLLRLGNDSVMCLPPTYCLPLVSSMSVLDKGWCAWAQWPSSLNCDDTRQKSGAEMETDIDGWRPDMMVGGQTLMVGDQTLNVGGNQDVGWDRV